MSELIIRLSLSRSSCSSTRGAPPAQDLVGVLESGVFAKVNDGENTEPHLVKLVYPHADLEPAEDPKQVSRKCVEPWQPAPAAAEYLRNHRTVSGEGLLDLDERSLFRLKERLGDSFKSVCILGYVDAPVRLMEAAFIRAVIQDQQAHLDLGRLWPRYRDSLEKLDRVFGRDHVILRPFPGATRSDQDAPQDGGSWLDEARRAQAVRHVDDSFSLEATAVLFAYNKSQGLQQQDQSAAIHDATQIGMLSRFGTRQLRFSQELVKPVILAQQQDLHWIEGRLGVSLCASGVLDEEAITSEQDLLDVAALSVDELSKFLTACLLQTDPTPQQIANLMERLRVAVTGRSSSGKGPATAISGFFTPQQRERLLARKVGPAAALRELALAFERSGRLGEALSCLHAALEFRPGSKGLRNLRDRIARKAGGKVGTDTTAGSRPVEGT